MAGRDARPKFPIGPFYTKDGRLFGFAMFNAPADEQRKCAAEINRWLAKGKLKPRIDRVMKLSEAAAAHQLQEDNTLRKAGTLAGKIVLCPRSRLRLRNRSAGVPPARGNLHLFPRSAWETREDLARISRHTEQINHSVPPW